MAVASAVSNFNSIRMLPFSERDVWPSERLWSGVKSKTNTKYPVMNILCMIWRPVFA